MKSMNFFVALIAPMLLAGCLEVEQHPVWRNGEYNGKKDNQHQQAYFHNDKLAWNAAIANRNHQQNEYRRTNP